jgi:hypothetical protein
MERRRKIAEKKAESALEELGHSYQPSLSAETQRICHEQSRGTTGGSQGPVHERLLAKAELSKQRKAELIRKRDMEEEEAMKPAISQHSKNVKRETSVPVTDRLYNYSYAIQKRQEALRTAVRDSEQRDSKDGRELYKPEISNRAARITRVEPVEDSLLKKGEAAERKKARARDVEEIKASNQSKSKFMNPTSAVLADMFEKRTASSTTDRLYKPKENKLKYVLSSLFFCLCLPSTNTISTGRVSSTPSRRRSRTARSTRRCRSCPASTTAPSTVRRWTLRPALCCCTRRRPSTT